MPAIPPSAMSFVTRCANPRKPQKPQKPQAPQKPQTAWLCAAALALPAMLPVAASAQASDAKADAQVGAEASAEANSFAEGDATSPWRFGLAGGVSNRFVTDIDNGGDVSVTSLFVQPSWTYIASRQLQLTGSVAAQTSRYDFGGSSGLGALDPFDQVNGLDVSLGLRHSVSEDWFWTAGASLKSAWEDGADLDDGFHGGGFGGAGFRINDDLMLGLAVGVIKPLEEDLEFLPVPLIDWQINDDWRLHTGRGLGSTRGPGLVLTRQLNDHWQASLAARSERIRFRLGDNAPGGLANGIGQDETNTVMFELGYKPSPSVELAIGAGVVFGGELRLENGAGQTIAEQDHDATPVVGLSGRIRF